MKALSYTVSAYICLLALLLAPQSRKSNLGAKIQESGSAIAESSGAEKPHRIAAADSKQTDLINSKRDSKSVAETTVSSDSVNLAWVAHYASDPIPLSDVAAGIAIDHDGYIYVTG